MEIMRGKITNATMRQIAQGKTELKARQGTPIYKINKDGSRSKKPITIFGTKSYQAATIELEIARLENLNPESKFII